MKAPAALPCSGPEVTRAQPTNNCTTITAISRPLQTRPAPEPYPNSGPVAARDPSSTALALTAPSRFSYLHGQDPRSDMCVTSHFFLQRSHSHSHRAFRRLATTSLQRWPENRRTRSAHMMALAALPCSGPEATRTQPTNSCASSITTISRRQQTRTALELYLHSGQMLLGTLHQQHLPNRHSCPSSMPATAISEAMTQ